MDATAALVATAVPVDAADDAPDDAAAVPVDAADDAAAVPVDATAALVAVDADAAAALAAVSSFSSDESSVFAPSSLSSSLT